MKDIKNYEGLYAVTEDGRVWSYRAQKFLKPHDNGHGYMCGELCKNGSRKPYKVHRIIAETFLDNPDNKPEVNHINGNRSDNRLENLEWATSKENNQCKSKAAKMRSVDAATAAKLKPIHCIELNKVFDSVKAASIELGIGRSSLSNCLTGKYKTAGGYHFEYLLG